MLKTPSLLCLLLIAAPAAALAQAQSGGGLTAPEIKSSKPAPRTADGHPDLSGFWKGTRQTKPVGNIGKDLPGRHRRKAREARFGHTLRRGLIQNEKTAARKARFI